MAKLRFQGEVFETGGDTVLDCLAAHGRPIPSGCRSGVCQSCLVQVVDGPVPEGAQGGLDEASVERGLLLACQARPREDLEIAPAGSLVERHAVRVLGLRELGPEVREMKLSRPAGYAFLAGQFLQLQRADGLARSYSIASDSARDDFLLLHVGRVPGGRMSSWVFDDARPGEQATVTGARGRCYLPSDAPTGQPLLLVATGTGLAPLRSILGEALRRGHEGRIVLYHGARDAGGLYCDAGLRALAQAHPQFTYEACVSRGEAPAGTRPGRASTLALADLPDLTGWRVFLCGNPAMVEETRREAFLAGAASSAIHCDSFLPSGD